MRHAAIKLGTEVTSPRQFEWTDLKYFLELVRSGTPASAARRLGVDHNTVRRRVTALESALQSRLFSSRGPTYDLTVQGDHLFKYAEAIEALTIRAEEAITSSDLAISGIVRVGAPNCFGSYFLARKLAELSIANPDLRLKVVVLPQVVNLSNRDADIAILLTPPNQLRQIIRKLTDYTMRIYSSAEYLLDAPPISTIEDLQHHRFVGYIPDLLDAPQLDVLPQLGKEMEAHFESASISAQIEAVAAGAGLCILPDFIASNHPKLQVVLGDSFSLKRDYWLAIHPEMINLARVRAVVDYIVESVRSDPLFCKDYHEVRLPDSQEPARNT
ncbi:MAG: LysR family transcriptional regulator [Pseudomonadota bacterium]